MVSQVAFDTCLQVLQATPSVQEVSMRTNKSKRDSLSQSERSSGSLGTFLLPQLLGVILKLMVGCEDLVLRMEILKDILRLLEANPFNSEALTLVCFYPYLFSVLSLSHILVYCLLFFLWFWSPQLIY